MKTDIITCYILICSAIIVGCTMMTDHIISVNTNAILKQIEELKQPTAMEKDSVICDTIKIIKQ